jgi:hypothetical protein
MFLPLARKRFKINPIRISLRREFEKVQEKMQCAVGPRYRGKSLENNGPHQSEASYFLEKN